MKLKMGDVRVSNVNVHWSILIPCESYNLGRKLEFALLPWYDRYCRSSLVRRRGNLVSGIVPDGCQSVRSIDLIVAIDRRDQPRPDHLERLKGRIQPSIKMIYRRKTRTENKTYSC